MYAYERFMSEGEIVTALLCFAKELGGERNHIEQQRICRRVLTKHPDQFNANLILAISWSYKVLKAHGYDFHDPFLTDKKIPTLNMTDKESDHFYEAVMHYTKSIENVGSCWPGASLPLSKQMEAQDKCEWVICGYLYFLLRTCCTSPETSQNFVMSYGVIVDSNKAKQKRGFQRMIQISDCMMELPFIRVRKSRVFAMHLKAVALGELATLGIDELPSVFESDDAEEQWEESRSLFQKAMATPSDPELSPGQKNLFVLQQGWITENRGDQMFPNEEKKGKSKLLYKEAVDLFRMSQAIQDDETILKDIQRAQSKLDGPW